MLKLNFPSFKFNIKNKDNKAYIFDIIRKKMLPHFLRPKKYEMIDYEPNKPIKIVGL